MAEAKKTAPKVEVVLLKAVLHKGVDKKLGDAVRVTATEKKVMQLHGLVKEDTK